MSTKWPGTRIGAVVFVACLFLLVLFPLVARALWGAYRGVRPKVQPESQWRIPILVMFPLLVACLAGFWLHFVPCFWWACDGGDEDRQATRGIIWGASTALFAIVGWALAASEYYKH